MKPGSSRSKLPSKAQEESEEEMEEANPSLAKLLMRPTWMPWQFY